MVVYETNLGPEGAYVEGFQSYLAVAADAGGSTTRAVSLTHGPVFAERLGRPDPTDYIVLLTPGQGCRIEPRIHG